MGGGEVMERFEGNPYRFANNKRQIPLRTVNGFLAQVEDSREWMETNAGKIDVRGQILKVGKKKVGLLTPFAFQQLRRQVDARPKKLWDEGHFDKFVKTDEKGNKCHDKDLVLAEHLRIVTKRLRSLDKPMHLRVQNRESGFNRVLTALTDRYEAIPYTEILDPFPKSFGVPRFAVDDRYLSLHVVEPKAFMTEGDGLHAGVRIMSSDIGAAKLSLSFEVFRIVCSNGMIAAETIFAVSKMHVTGIREEWAKIVKEWQKEAASYKREMKEFIEASRKAKVTEEQATDELLDLRLPRKRIERAIDIAQKEFGELSRWSIANGITQASQESMTADPRDQRQPAISTGNVYDMAATAFMRRAA